MVKARTNDVKMYVKEMQFKCKSVPECTLVNKFANVANIYHFWHTQIVNITLQEPWGQLASL